MNCIENTYAVPTRNYYEILSETDLDEEQEIGNTENEKLKALVKANIGSNEVLLFLDTGSSVNLMSADKYYDDFSHLQLYKNNVPKMSGIVPGQQIATVGTVYLPITLGKHKFSLETIVANNINHNGTILLGLTDMARLQIRVFTDRKGISIKNTFIPFVHNTRLSKSAVAKVHKYSKNKNEEKRSILKKRNIGNLYSNWIYKEKDNLVIRHGDAKRRRKLLILDINNYEVCPLQFKNTCYIRNMDKNDYRVVMIKNGNPNQDINQQMDAIESTINNLDTNFQVMLSTGNTTVYNADRMKQNLTFFNNNKRYLKNKCLYVGSNFAFAKELNIDYMCIQKYFGNIPRKMVTFADIEETETDLSINNIETEVEVNKDRQPDKNEIPMISNVSIMTNANIESQQSSWLTCTLSKKCKKKNLAMILPETSRIIGLVLEHGLYHIKEGKITLKAYNIRNKELNLQKGNCIGHAEILDEVEDFDICNIVNDIKDDSNRDQQFAEDFNKTDYPEHEEKVKDILKKYDNIIALKDDKLGITSIIEHHISVPKDMKPIYIPMYKVAHSQKEKIENEVEKLLQNDIIEESNTPWSFPLLAVPKKNGETRIVVDFRKLNEKTETDPYPMPSMVDLLNSIGKSNFFSSIDLQQGFLQVPLDTDSKNKTGFSTSNAHYVYKRMPFGLKSSPTTFVRLIHQVFKGLLGKIIFSYIDDLFIIGDTIEEHLRNLDVVLQRLQNANLKIKLKKCFFLRKACTFLGHTITADGVKVTDDKVKSIMSFKQPKDVKSLRSFLGLAGFYRKFVKGFSKIAAPLTDLLKKDVIFEWKQEQEDAFQCLKNKLTTAPILAFPDFNKQFYLQTDASGIGLGSALMQKYGNSFKVIGYHSRKFNKAELNYNITEKEALSVIDSLKHFRYIIFGYPIIIQTDHLAIREIFKYPNHSGRRARWFLTTLDYNIKIEYLPGKENIVADCLSRYDMEVCTIQEIPKAQLDNDIIRNHQRNDVTLFNIIQTLQADEAIPETMHSYRLSELEIIDGILMKNSIRRTIIIPKSLIEKVLYLTHDLRNHPGREETIKQTQLRFTWTGMYKDVKSYIKHCHKCASCKGTTRKQPIGLYPIPETPFEKVVIDLLRLNHTPKGNLYILVVTDYLTRFTELMPQKTKTAYETASNLLNFIHRYGAPEVILSDNGNEFENKLLKELLKFYYTQKVSIIPYHPQGNGVAERVNRQIIEMIRLSLPHEDENWDDHIPHIQYLINTRIHNAIKTSPYQALYGYQPRQPYEINTAKYNTVIENNPIEARINNAQLMHKKVNEALKASNVSMKQYENSNDQFKIGDLIYEKRILLGTNYKTQPTFQGPFKIVEKRVGNKYIIQDIDSKECKLSHSDRFKQFSVNTDITTEENEIQSSKNNMVLRRSERLAAKN